MSGVVANSVAASSAGQGRQRTAAPFSVVGRPAAPTQRSREIGWSMMPRIGRPCAGQRDQCAEQRHAADKGFRAVDRIQHPDEFGIVAGAAELLADDAVLREPLLDQRSHRRFRRAVGGGDRAQIRPCRRPRAVGGNMAGSPRPRHRPGAARAQEMRRLRSLALRPPLTFPLRGPLPLPAAAGRGAQRLAPSPRLRGEGWGEGPSLSPYPLYFSVSR